MGEGGAGHFVKMVHNGIEYGDMQLICEAWHIMSVALGMSESECSQVFKRWNSGLLESFLIEITGDILAYKDEDGQPRRAQHSRHSLAKRHGQMDSHHPRWKRARP